MLYKPVCVGDGVDGGVAGGTVNAEVVHFNRIVVKLFKCAVFWHAIFESSIIFVKMLSQCVFTSSLQNTIKCTFYYATSPAFPIAVTPLVNMSSIGVARNFFSGGGLTIFWVREMEVPQWGPGTKKLTSL